MSSRKIKSDTLKAKKRRAQKAINPAVTNAAAQLMLTRAREREADKEAVRRYIHDKDFDMEYRYDEEYRARWAKRANMKRSRFNDALDAVIAEAWEAIRNGQTPTNPETGE